MNKVWKRSAGFYCLIVLSEEFVEVEDGNLCTAPIMANKDILEFVQTSKNIIEADYDVENEMNNEAPRSVFTSSEMRNVVKVCAVIWTHIPKVK
ncbi:hypothetical protein TNCV_3186821 [Trichonephila clavipes]|nr:hypothetical protein TNCV_3186821 [Trichonephila clavipes]